MSSHSFKPGNVHMLAEVGWDQAESMGEGGSSLQ